MTSLALPYASISRRFIALILDGLIIGIPCAIANHLIPVAGGFLVAVLYSPILESSPARATIGKYLMGLQVVDLNGRRIPFSSALVRYFMKIVSSMLCFLGYAIALLTERKQTLHDLVAETVVIDGKNDVHLVDAWLKEIKSLFANLKSASEKLGQTTAGSETKDRNDPSFDKYLALEKLQALREKGTLTEEEFQQEKQKILNHK